MTPRGKVDRVVWCDSPLRLSMKFKSLLLYCVLLCTMAVCGVLRATSTVQFQAAHFEANEGNGAEVSGEARITVTCTPAPTAPVWATVMRTGGTAEKDDFGSPDWWNEGLRFAFYPVNFEGDPDFKATMV